MLVIKMLKNRLLYSDPSGITKIKYLCGYGRGDHNLFLCKGATIELRYNSFPNSMLVESCINIIPVKYQWIPMKSLVNQRVLNEITFNFYIMTIKKTLFFIINIYLFLDK
jgi:hypothetical protein